MGTGIGKVTESFSKYLYRVAKLSHSWTLLPVKRGVPDGVCSKGFTTVLLIAQLKNMLFRIHEGNGGNRKMQMKG